MRLSAGFVRADRRRKPLHRFDQRIAALIRQRYAVIDDARKRDARQKIQLGGLVVKAGLRDGDKAFILGALLDAAKLQSGTPEYERLKIIGQKLLK